MFKTSGAYITGTTIALEPFHRIVQTWRTSEFTDGDADSQIDVTFEAVDEGTLIRVRHTNVPDGQRGYENGGWQQSYFDPMRVFFSSR